MYINIDSLGYTPEANRISYANYTSIKRKTHQLEAGRYTQHSIHVHVCPRRPPSGTPLLGCLFPSYCYHLDLRRTFTKFKFSTSLILAPILSLPLPILFYSWELYLPPHCAIQHHPFLFYLLTSCLPG